ncbi:protein Dr1-like [Dysidea avara]|uniref:protein Dr1-like n=1 Tax=Dysidea avara TaxID=196820 RepID=UPI003319D1D4
MAEDSSPQDDELHLPRTAVNKLIKEIVPHARIPNDTRDLLLSCCSEFIHLIASEASEISDREQRKTILPEHIIEALTGLGFTEYMEDVKSVYQEYKVQAAKRRREKSKLEKLGIPEEELLRQQQELFAQARAQQLQSNPEYQMMMQQMAVAAAATASSSSSSLQQQNVQVDTPNTTSEQ